MVPSHRGLHPQYVYSRKTRPDTNRHAIGTENGQTQSTVARARAVGSHRHHNRGRPNGTQKASRFRLVAGPLGLYGQMVTGLYDPARHFGPARYKPLLTLRRLASRSSSGPIPNGRCRTAGNPTSGRAANVSRMRKKPAPVRVEPDGSYERGRLACGRSNDRSSQFPMLGAIPSLGFDYVPR